MKFLLASMFSLVVAVATMNAYAAPVDINTADAATLDRSLKGIGPRTAAAIVDYRSKNGPFKTVDDLAKVKGIGPALIDKNRANLTVGGGGAMKTSGSAAPNAGTTGASTGGAK